MVEFIEALCAVDNFDRLGILRLHLFKLVQDDSGMLGRQRRLRVLSFLTQEALKSGPFERDVCRLLTAWLWTEAHEAQDSAVSQRADELAQRKQMLTMAGNLLKVSSVALFKPNP